MATSPLLPAQPASTRTGIVAPVRLGARLLIPSISDCLLIAVLLWVFATGSGWEGLLSDGDTGFHIRAGDWILDNGRVPSTDLFSFTKPDKAWYAWEWGTQALFAWLHRMAGLKGVVLFSAVIIALYGTLLFRHMLWRGATPFAALFCALLTFGASWVHYLARPHLFTLLGLTISLWMIDADRRAPSRRIWLLAPMTAIWVNLHGGFLALIACLGIVTAASAAGEWWKRVEGGSADWNAPLRYAALTAVCGLSSLANPYGWTLHQHVIAFLQDDWWKKNVQEFMPPNFHKESVRQFELMLFLALMSFPAMIGRRAIAAVLMALYWGHQSLNSTRHIPLFMIVAAPVVADWLTDLWTRSFATAPAKSIRGILGSINADIAPACRRSSLWVPAVIVFLAAPLDQLMRWPTDFPERKYPVEMVTRHADRLLNARVLTWDEWGDYLIYRQFPKQRVFIDGRLDFYGGPFGEEFLTIVQGKKNWDRLLDQYGVDHVLAPPQWPLVTLLERDPRWRLVESRRIGALYERVLPDRASTAVPSERASAETGKKAPPLS